ncbi:MAG TPA: ATP-binding protein [Terriglobales bacterium]|nr:ATP-binding protein [Terriglobales bacterium]
MPWEALRRLDSNLHRSNARLHYCFALLFVALALALDFTPFASGLPSLAFMGAVALSARYGGFGPALLATLVSALAVDYFFLAPIMAWSVDPKSLFQLLFFTAISLIIASVARQRSQAEDLVVKERAVLYEILDTISEGFLVLDSNWNVLYVNPQGARLAHTTPDMMLHQNLWALYPDLKGTIVERNYRRALAEQVTIRFDHFYEPLEKWFHITVDPMPGRLTIFYQDMTERKTAEDTLRRSEKLATAGRLAATMAHEINNPLEGITNLLYLLRHNSSLDQKARQHVEMADQELARLSHLTRQSLGFYRDHSAPSPVDLQQMMDEVLSIHQRRLNGRNIAVEKQYGSGAVINGIGGELRQVMLNLVLNAIDAMPENGRLTVRVRNTRAWNDSERPGVRFSIADNGSGIGKQHLSHLFEPFYTTKKDVGTGLGLWISHELVAKHSGWIRVRSSTDAANQGTVFSVFIPKLGPEENEQEPLPHELAS